MALPVSVQLFSLRDPLKADFEGTLKTLADIGFQHVEFAGFYGKTAAEVKAICDELGLKPSGAHVGLDAMRTDFDAVIADAKTLGYSHVVLPYLGDEHRTTAGYKAIAATLTDLAPKAEAAGITLGYHNHDFEFIALPEGGTGFEILMNNTPESVIFELDCMWVDKAGQLPVAWIQKLGSRAPLLHIKDRPADAEKTGRRFTEVGTGVVDIANIVKTANQTGVKYLVIEQDNDWQPDPINSIKTSFDNLAGMND